MAVAEFRQVSTPGGHMVIMETEVADGQLRIEMTWQHVIDEHLDVAGSVMVQRAAYLNGMVVKDPAWAERLWAEACQR